MPTAKAVPCRSTFPGIHEACERARDACTALENASLFVTGGTGFVGSWLLAFLLHANRERKLGLSITLLTRDPERFRAQFPVLAGDEAVRLLPGDAADFQLPRRRFTHVIHGAAELSPGETQSAAEGAAAKRIAERFAEAGSKRLLFLSSGAVYGSIRGPADERRALEGGSAYALAKRAAEAALAKAPGIEVVTARIFSLVGPGMPLDSHFAMGNFLRDAVAGKEIQVRGDGSAVRSYLYAADLAAWLVTLLTRGRAGAAYNVGSDEAVSIASLAALVAATVPGSGPAAAPAGASGAEERPYYVPSIERARDELGLRAWTGLKEAIRLTAAAI